MAMDLKDLGIEPLLQAVMDTVPDGITVIDRDLNVLFHNEAIRQMFGEITGHRCYKAYRGRDEPCEQCTVLKVLEDGQPRRLLEDTRAPNGEVMWMECSSGALRDAEGHIVGAVELVRNVTDQMRLTEECATLRREVRRQVEFENILTQSKSIKTLFRLIERVGPTRSAVLITGASGTGKELFAKALWQHSDRADRPFVPVNCSAIPEDLIESELFGHVQGAFTGATADRKGLIEMADGGTLFLDEIAELPLALQPKLLRFLQEGEVRPVGAERLRRVDVRVVAATNRDLEEAVSEGAFREDLYYRLAVIPMHLPPLRERREDIPLLATGLLQRMCDDTGRAVTGFSPRALQRILGFGWPGNVRQLENAVEYGLHLTDDGRAIDVDQLPAFLQDAPGGGGGGGLASLADDEWVSIEAFTQQAIRALEGEHTEEEIAERLGISRKTLWQKRKRWGLSRP